MVTRTTRASVQRAAQEKEIIMSETQLPNESEADVQAAEALHQKHQLILEQMRGIIVGQDEVIEQLLVTLLCRGHCILEGVPGLAKTLIVSTLASLLSQTFRRIQFTPDLMPSDITGTDILEEDRTTGKRVFRFIPGPLFGNMILADEINRTPPKTQSALLEATQERQLTVAGQTYPLPNPFMVLATQNPIEQEGTYPLPEAQLDRFMLKILVEYPTREQEMDIAKRASTNYSFQISKVLTVEEILAMQDLVKKMPVGEHVYEFAVDLVRRSRPTRGSVSGYVNQMVAWGAGPRAVIFLLLAAKARAILQGRFHATTADVCAMALPVLRHRLIPSFNAEASGQNSDQIIARLVDEMGGGPPRPTPQTVASVPAQHPPVPPPIIRDGGRSGPVKMRGV
jgi:MoxR-like ATPase